jgi:peptidoglycan/LPS O-acetylase OafA/YrhL
VILVYGLFVASLFFSKIPFGKTSEAIVILFCCYVFTQILVRVNSHIKLLQMIAKYSYFTYYCHFYILILLEKLYSKYIALNNTILKSYEFTFLTFFMITLAICLALGKLSYRYFEVKLISLGQKTVSK